MLLNEHFSKINLQNLKTIIIVEKVNSYHKQIFENKRISIKNIFCQTIQQLWKKITDFRKYECNNGKMEKVNGKICGNKQPAIERMFGK